MSINESEFIILTLDAGGTNFVFSAMQQGKFIGKLIHLPATTKDELLCTQTIIKGFELLKHQFKKKIRAISFAFPGPADYKNGIIGDLPNFPGINGNYPLKAILEEHFKIPVFINNDGNLFAYGEALSGSLPKINAKLKEAGTPKTFTNLIGITLGTGIGGGIVINGMLLQGDNSSSAEIHNMSNPNQSSWNIEESISTRAIQRVYAEQAKIPINPSLMPKHIYEIALGKMKGDKDAANNSFKEYGKTLGHAIINIITLVDGLIVIGGGITKAWNLFSPGLFDVINAKYITKEASNKTTVKIFNLEDQIQQEQFLKGDVEIIRNSSLKVDTRYDSLQRTGIILSRIGANNATSLGAYHFAIEQLNNN